MKMIIHFNVIILNVKPQELRLSFPQVGPIMMKNLIEFVRWDWAIDSCNFTNWVCAVAGAVNIEVMRLPLYCN